MVRTLSILVIVGIAAGPLGCASGFAARWEGSGEIQEGRFFSFELDARKPEHATAGFRFGSEATKETAVCGLKEKDGRVEFQMDVESRPATCADMKSVTRFSGTMGANVLTGQMTGPDGRVLGPFRAFRAVR